MSGTSALDHMNPDTGWLTPHAARRLVDWQISPELQSRIEDPDRKANSGTLFPDEDAEYRADLDGAEVISLLQAKTHRCYLPQPDWRMGAPVRQLVRD